MGMIQAGGVTSQSSGSIDPAVADGFAVTDSTGRIVWSPEKIETSLALLNSIALGGNTTTSAFTTLDATLGTTVYTDLTGRILWSGTPTGFGAVQNEVLAARGSQPDLNTRLNQSLDSSGNPLTPSVGLHYMRRAHFAATKIDVGEAAQSIVALIGDSYTQNAGRYAQGLHKKLVAKYGDAGAGWFGFGSLTGNGSFIGGNVRPDIRPLTTSGTAGGFAGWSWTYYTAPTADLGYATSSTVGDYQQISLDATHPAISAAILHFMPSADGVVSYQWDGGVATNVNVQGVAAGRVALGNIPAPAGAHTLKIAVVSGTVNLAGIDIQSNANGVRVHKLGSTGSRIDQWAAVDATQWQAALTSLGATSVQILDGTNSQGAGEAVAAWATSMTTVIARVRAALPVPDILITMPPENFRGLTPAMTAYAAQGRVLAASLGCAFLDLQSYFDTTIANYRSTGVWPRFNADDIHPDPLTGGRVMIGAIAPFFMFF